jgi:hypothetical protein
MSIETKARIRAKGDGRAESGRSLVTCTS